MPFLPKAFRLGGYSFFALLRGRFLKEAVVIAACIGAVAGLILGLMAAWGGLAIPGVGPIVTMGVVFVGLICMAGGAFIGAVFGVIIGLAMNSDH